MCKIRISLAGATEYGIELLAVNYEVMGFFSSRRPEQIEEPPNHDATVVQVIRSRFVGPPFLQIANRALTSA